ncbi:hypothetical protein [Bacteroides sp.]
MSTIELDAARAEIIRSLFEVDSLEALQKVKRSVARIVKSAQTSSTEDLTPYTMEELNARIDEAEAADEADNLVSHNEVMSRARKYIATL